MATVFADAAKYVLTARIVGSLIAEKLSIDFSIALMLMFALSCNCILLNTKR